jgi:hypothetical protein
MNVISHIQRRVLAAAVTCAAVLMPTAALAMPGHPAAHAAALGHRPASAASATPRCASSGLRVWLGVPGEGAAGSIFYELELSNISNHTCTLFGFPGVSAEGLGGSRLGSPAGRSNLDPENLVTLARGATSHVFLQIVDVGVFPPSSCDPVTAIGLRVFAPNTATAAIVPFSFQACKKQGPIFLRVTATVAGTGIPGFNH